MTRGPRAPLGTPHPLRLSPSFFPAASATSQLLSLSLWSLPLPRNPTCSQTPNRAGHPPPLLRQGLTDRPPRPISATRPSAAKAGRGPASSKKLGCAAPVYAEKGGPRAEGRGECRGGGQSGRSVKEGVEAGPGGLCKYRLILLCMRRGYIIHKPLLAVRGPKGKKAGKRGRASE